MANNALSMQEQANPIDVLILNAEVVDGSGAPAIKQDVAIREDKIVAIGNLQQLSATQTIDASGLILAPGFIDVHTHDDLEC